MLAGVRAETPGLYLVMKTIFDGTKLPLVVDRPEVHYRWCRWLGSFLLPDAIGCGLAE
jgi:hypothetical protein